MDGFRNFSECAYEDDAARVSLGGNWRTPTDEEWEALRKKCTWTWTTVNGVNGRMVKASNGNSIFLPAAGYISNTDNDSKLTKGYYWSFAMYPYIPYEALSQDFNAEHVYDSSYITRCSGMSIRPVTE